MRIFTTSNTFLLHLSHTSCLTFDIRGGKTTGQHLFPFSLFSESEMKKNTV